MTKKVSIVVITYNGERFLRKQLDTLIAQTYPIYEIIIQDDGSTDGTWDIMEEYAEKYQHIHIFHNEWVHGVNGNVFSAIDRATGELVALCDQDDIWEPQKIEEQVKMIGDAMLIGGTTQPFSEDGSPIRFDPRPANCNAIRMIFTSAIPGHTMLFRPELFNFFKKDINGPCYDMQLQIAASAMESMVYQGVCPVHHRRFCKSVSYMKPVNNTRNISNTLDYLMACVKLYSRVRPAQIRIMNMWHQFFLDIHAQTITRAKGLRLTELLMSTDVISKLRLLTFCYRNRQFLFYAQEKDCIKLKIRALLFPLSSVYYIRGYAK